MYLKVKMDNKIVQSIKWSGLAEFLSKSMVPLINIVLARVLLPEVFGVVATFSMVIALAEVFTDAGFHKYLIQHEFENQRDQELCINVAFWTNLIFSSVVWFIIFIFRSPIAELVGSKGYGIEISVMSLTIILSAFSSIQSSIYKRNFKFKQLLPIRLVICAVPLFVTVPMALIFRNCWAIIIGALVKYLISIALYWVKSDWKPRFEYSFAKLKEMFSFSSTIMVDSVMVWFTTYADTFIVSRYLTLYYIGIYKTGVTTIGSYIVILFNITSPILFSALSREQNNRENAIYIYYSFQKYCSLLIIPLGFGIFIYRDFVTMVLLGSQWSESSLILGCIALCMAYCVVTSLYNSDFFRAMGKPQIALLVQSIFTIILIAGLIPSASQSFEFLSIARAVLGFSYAIISTFCICIFFNVALLQILRNLIYPTIASLIMMAAAWGLQQVYSGVLWTIISILTCIIVYGIVIMVIPPTRKDILRLKSVNIAVIKAKLKFENRNRGSQS